MSMSLQPAALAGAAPSQGQHWLSFWIGAQLYAAPLADVSEVIRDGGLTPVPGAADDLLGVRHLRGNIVPIMDGRRRLGLPASPPANPATARIVMLSHAGQRVGLRVDAIGELLNSEDADIGLPPAGRAQRSDDPVSGVLGCDGGFAALLDVRRLCRQGGELAHVA